MVSIWPVFNWHIFYEHHRLCRVTRGHLIQYVIGHFRDDLSSQSLDLYKNRVFSTNHVAGNSEPNPTYDTET